MKVPKQEIERAVKEGGDTVYRGVRAVRVDGNRLIASDGYILAIIPRPDGLVAEGEKIEGLIGPDALRVGRTLTKALISIEEDKVIVKAREGTLTFPLPTGSYPDFDIILPKPEETSQDPTISFDAELLLSICKAIGSTKVRLWVRGTERAIIVKSLNSNEELGLLMPLSPVTLPLSPDTSPLSPDTSPPKPKRGPAAA